LRAAPPTELGVSVPASAPDRAAQARDLFRTGRAQYDLGNYQDAVQSFRSAYELAPAADLLLDIAQAHRMAGECAKALVVYRSFLRLSSNEEKKSLARGHELALAATCERRVGTSEATITAPPLQPMVMRPHPSPRTQLAAKAAIIAGGVVVCAAAALWLWNQGRFSSWQKEDTRLHGEEAAREPTTTMTQRQDGNDSLLRSIRRTDDISLGLAIGGAAVAASAVAVNVFLARRAVRLALSPTSAFVSLSFH
jgi:tetratricopeptide (TPR) repeat protein